MKYTEPLTAHLHFRVRWRRFVFFLIALVLALLLVLLQSLQPPIAMGAAVTVTTTLDVVDGDTSSIAALITTPGPDGFISLREAIIAANADAFHDTITLPAGTYTLTLVGTGEGAAANGDLDINTDLTLNGAGKSSTIIDGNGSVTGEGVFFIFGAMTVDFNNLTIQNGSSPANGGGISNLSTTTLTNVSILGNESALSAGGIYASGGPLILNNVTLSDNVSGNVGGGMFIYGGDVTISNSVFNNNRAENVSTDPSGGGIYNNSAGTITIENTTFIGNDADGSGGAIAGNDGAINLTDVSFSFNQALTSDGGGISISGPGTLTVSDSIFDQNVAAEGGGALAIGNQTTVVVDGSTFMGNWSDGATDGGGAIRQTGPSLTITNSTISGNDARNHGGGIYVLQVNAGTTLTNVTITDNSADLDSVGGGDGGGIYTLYGPVTLTNTIIAGNAGDQCSKVGTGAFVTNGHNLSSDATCDLTDPDDLPSTPANLAPLADNGGPTLTHTLMYNSAAIDAGDASACPGVDQRGVSRPEGTTCDIGAVERVQFVPVDFSANDTSDVVVFRGGAWRFFDYPSASFDHGVWTGTSIGCFKAPMDYDGDGGAEPTQLCSGAWHFYNDDGSYNKGIWTGGVPGDLPVPADYNGDGIDEVVVWRAGAWRFFDFASGAFDYGVWTGSPPHWLGGESIPVPMDYDGDGRAEFTVWSGGPWHFYNDNGTYNKGIWTGGVATDLPVPADYSGNLREQVVVFRDGAWRFFDFDSAMFTSGVWTGAPPHWLGGTPLPSPLDYDGDGDVDFTVWSGGPWHFYDNAGVYAKGIWTGGVAGDLPISRRMIPMP